MPVLAVSLLADQMAPNRVSLRSSRRVVSCAAGGQQLGDVAWSRSGDQGNVWRQAMVALPASPSRPHRVLFRGTKAAGPLGDIALDDVLILDSGCGQCALHESDFPL